MWFGRPPLLLNTIPRRMPVSWLKDRLGEFVRSKLKVVIGFTEQWLHPG